MNTKTYTKEEITAYLLGSLPDAETELFDELSFTDDDFAGALSAAEKDLIDAYVQGELAGERREKFETYYLASPLRREKVEFARAFQTFAEEKIAETNAETPAADGGKPPRSWQGFFADLLTIPRLSMQWGLAAAGLAFLLFGSWFLLENSRLRSEVSRSQSNRDELLQRETELKEREKQLRDEIAGQQANNSEREKELARVREERERLERELKKRQTQEQQRTADLKRQNEQLAETKKTPVSSPNRPVTIASFILTPPVRGTAPTLSIPGGTTSVAMRLELEADEFASYRVVLRDPSNGRILWRSGNLKHQTSGANKYLNVGFSANLLKSQIYSLEVAGISPDGAAEIIGDYSFRIVR